MTCAIYELKHQGDRLDAHGMTPAARGRFAGWISKYKEVTNDELK